VFGKHGLVGSEMCIRDSVLGDLVSQIVGDRAQVQALMPVGVDPHEFQPSSSQVAAMAQADLVVANGLGLEEGILDLLTTLEGDGANVLWVGELVEPLPFDREGSICNVSDGEMAEGSCDPHVWLDPVRMIEASRAIGEALEVIDPAVDWSAGVDGYVAELEGLDTDVRELIAAIPPTDRLLVASHEALAYFATRYGFEIVGTVVPGGSTLADPSSAQLEELVRVIDSLGIPAIFAESLSPTILAEAVASEAAHPVEVVVLYTGSLGAPGSGADTYVGMILTDARLIVDALSP
ncbi:MAG: metal ABC transporter substrate-binding protein, partial [Actinomycetia bacterium]|nr:metal ABC transporter substrate-binding protein [Actinomycetes bacterium]